MVEEDEKKKRLGRILRKSRREGLTEGQLTVYRVPTKTRQIMQDKEAVEEQNTQHQREGEKGGRVGEKNCTVGLRARRRRRGRYSDDDDEMLE